MMAAQPRQVRMFQNMVKMQQQQLTRQVAIVNINQRAFAKKKKKTKKTEDELSEYETVEENVEEEPVVASPVATPAEEKLDFSGASASQPAPDVKQDLFGAFSVGSIKEVNSAPNNKPPIAEDTIEGRYAGVLFSTASEQESLYAIYEDFTYIKALYDNSEAFYLFTQNAGVGAKEIQ